jgi:sulfatase modifying factor 1
MKWVNGFGALVLTAPVALACSTNDFISMGALGTGGNGAGGDSTIPAEGGRAGAPGGGTGGGQVSPPDQTGGTQNGGTQSGGTETGGTETGGTETGGTASTGGTGNSAGCPVTGGPSMVMLPEGYCIDSTEVTRAQYQAWLDANPSTDGQISDCTWNTTFAPDATCMSDEYVCQGSGCENHPQVCVDWCDAYAYCQAVGKRLCGKIGSGSNGYSDSGNADLSQWYNACTSQGVNAFVYGNSFDRTACNGLDYPGTSLMTVTVGTLSTCQSSVPGYSGVYDLIGNVAEWEDSCDGTTGETDQCRTRGASFGASMIFLTCAYNSPAPRNGSGEAAGIRCCS